MTKFSIITNHQQKTFSWNEVNKNMWNEKFFATKCNRTSNLDFNPVFCKYHVICSAFLFRQFGNMQVSRGKFILFLRREKEGREKLFCRCGFWCGWSGLQMCFFLCGGLYSLFCVSGRKKLNYGQEFYSGGRKFCKGCCEFYKLGCKFYVGGREFYSGDCEFYNGGCKFCIGGWQFYEYGYEFYKCSRQFYKNGKELLFLTSVTLYFDFKVF